MNLEERPIKELIEAIQNTHRNRKDLEDQERDLREFLELELLDRIERAYAIQKNLIRKNGLYRLFPRLIRLRMEAQFCVYAIIGLLRIKPLLVDPLLKRIDVYEKVHHAWT